MNTELIKKVKTDFQTDFFNLMNYAVFGKTLENVRKYRDIKFVTTKVRTNYLVSEPTIIQQNKPVSLALSILEISNIVMYEFWYNYLKPK